MHTRSGVHCPTDELVGDSASIEELRYQAIQLARFDVNVLLYGESGTGKEVIARTIHRLSTRSGGPFIGVNCAAIHESLLESELFGHEAGAFTGAGRPTMGFLRAADGGTILFDEVGDMSRALQSKLLRVLEERAVVPVGGTRAIPIDVRVISATHRDLAAAVRDGTFRRDLYYRLKVVCLSIPPLRDRRNDILPLARHMLKKIADALQLPVKKLSPSAGKIMLQYDWPGNVRELGNVIQRAYVFGHGAMIEAEDLPAELLCEAAGPDRSFPTLHEAVGQHVAKALELSDGVRNRAAHMLAIDRKTLRRMLLRHTSTT